ncbi:MAG: hypothetical protein EZS28_054094, partial [Streblomastix strix]
NADLPWLECPCPIRGYPHLYPHRQSFSCTPTGAGHVLSSSIQLMAFKPCAASSVYSSSSSSALSSQPSFIQGSVLSLQLDDIDHISFSLSPALKFELRVPELVYKQVSCPTVL